MDGERLDSFLLSKGRFFNNKDIRNVERVVSKVKTEDVVYLSVLGFRNPTIMVLVSFFLGWFGVDRFFLSQIKRGILKALTFPMQVLSLSLIFNSLFKKENLAFFENGEETFDFWLMLGIFFLVVFIFLVIYCIVDIFLIYNDTYEYNYKILVDFVENEDSPLNFDGVSAKNIVRASRGSVHSRMKKNNTDNLSDKNDADSIKEIKKVKRASVKKEEK